MFMSEQIKNELELQRDHLEYGLNIIKEALWKSGIAPDSPKMPQVQECINAIAEKISKVETEIQRDQKLKEREQRLGVK
jgi:hypothetical protein